MDVPVQGVVVRDGERPGRSSPPRRGRTSRSRTRYLVGARTVRDQPVRACAFAKGFDKHASVLIPNYEEWYVGDIDLEPEWLYLFFDRTITGYFATVFHKDGKIIAVATGTRQGAESVRGVFREVHRLSRGDGHGLAIEQQSGTVRVRRARHVGQRTTTSWGTGNALLAGEAGRLQPLRRRHHLGPGDRSVPQASASCEPSSRESRRSQPTPMQSLPRSRPARR